MIDISVKNLVKSFDVNKNILDGLSFEINAGERVGLMGINGAGKTTLFRILAGELGEDTGDVVIASGKRVGLISQIPVYPEGYTVEDVLISAHAELLRARDRLEALTREMSAENASSSVFAEYDRMTALFESRGGYDIETERDKVANGLDIPPKMRGQLFSCLSGGERTRVNLARLILEDTDILLLDEPTNHLDLKATEWLEDYLLRFKGTVLAISHDRWFLDRVVNRIIELAAGKAEFYSGNYSFYAVEKQRRFDEQLKKHEKEQKELKRLDEAARRLYQWGTGNQSLMKKSKAIRSRMERVEKTERPKTEKRIRAGFGEKDFTGDEALIIEGVSKAYGDNKLFEGLELSVKGGERIALIGDNGTGKSTLLRIIMGLEQADGGGVRKSPQLKSAYLPQIIEFSNPARSALDTVIYDCDCSAQTARNRLGAFKFSGEDVNKPVSALSGGEKSRLRLCMLMKEDINLLILDEPTNHLDISSREWIERAIDGYGEALIFVSHDRYFIDLFATRIWSLENGEITDFRGGLAEYREFKEREKTVIRRKNDAKRRENRKKDADTPEKQLSRIEREIAALERTIQGIDGEMQRFSTDYEKLLELTKTRSEAESELEPLYEKWEELALCLDKNET